MKKSLLNRFNFFRITIDQEIKTMSESNYELREYLNYLFGIQMNEKMKDKEKLAFIYKRADKLVQQLMNEDEEDE
jgi:hypothetical protein